MTYVIAHRGASRAAPENTLEAFRTARRLGADWVELDVRRTADDAIVVHHDARLADGRALVELPLSALADLPHLAEAVESCAGMGVNIEIKNSPGEPDHDPSCRLATAVAGLVASLDPGFPVLVSSFDRESLARLRAVDPSVSTGWLTFDLTDPERVVRETAAGSHASLHPYVGCTDRRLVALAHDAGLAVNVWTVDDPGQMAELVDWGVDGIITNVPDVARQVVDARPTP
jgi:glycerophosphoryl diester phosphodiesterase